MANLNFQQPPRSIANTSLTSRSTGSFGGSSLSGHLTPTSSMFSTNVGNYTQVQQPQLSPNRNAQVPIGGNVLSNTRPNLFGQRAFGDRRNVQGGISNGGGGVGSGPMSSMGNFMQTPRSMGVYGTGGIGGLGGGIGGPLNNFHNVFGNSSGDGPALLDPSEFPSLTNARGQNDQTLPQTNPLQPPGSKPYVGMVKQPASEQSEFTMSNEDFPALPGTAQISDGTSNSVGMSHESLDSAEKSLNPQAVSNNSGIGLGAVGSSLSVSGGSNSTSGIATNIVINSNSIIDSSGMHSGGLSGSTLSVSCSTSALSSLGCGNSDSTSNSTMFTGHNNSYCTNNSLMLNSNTDSNVNTTNSNTSIGNVVVMNAISSMTDSNNIEYMNANISNNEKLLRMGVQTHIDGKVTNIPRSMINNQFGMVGLLTFIRAAETDQNLVTLALGQDLTGLGLNLNSIETLHPTFAGPFADHSCRTQDIEYNVPHEYLINFGIKDKLATPVLKKLQDDLLFFLFYTNIGDIMQLMAAAELHSREWRYHTEEKIWITRIPGINQYEKNGTKERGTFYYFDAQSWKRMPKDFQIDAEKLDKCPNISSFGQSV